MPIAEVLATLCVILMVLSRFRLTQLLTLTLLTEVLGPPYEMMNMANFRLIRHPITSPPGRTLRTQNPPTYGGMTSSGIRRIRSAAGLHRTSLTSPP